MPRDGSGIYNKPFPDVVEGTTIESAVHNGEITDIALDLNTPRPIIAGGTGANSARDAMVALGGEFAGQVVTNYDMFAFAAGSFRSAAGAVSAPTGNDFAGICYLSDPNYIVLEARDWSTGKLYVRRKLAGTWDAAWTEQIGNVTDLDARFVNVNGDTMTGPLTINHANGLFAVGSVGSAPTTTTGAYYFGNSGTKYLVFDGTVFVLNGGDLICNSGLSAGANGISTSGGIRAGNAGASGTYYFGNTVGKYLTYDGTAFTLNGGAINVNGSMQLAGQVYANGPLSHIIAGGSVYTGYANATTGTYYFGNNTAKSLSYDGVVFNLTDSLHLKRPGTYDNISGNMLGVSYEGGNTRYGIELRPVTDSTNPLLFVNAAGGICGSIFCNATATAYNTSSSAELKEDLKAFDAGNIIDNTNVYDFAWKSTGERSYGVIAQQAVEVYPTAVTHTVQVDDKGAERGDSEFWGVDYSKYVPVLLQELKALRARVADLEGRSDLKPQRA
jgi:hypothetical protein